MSKPSQKGHSDMGTRLEWFSGRIAIEFIWIRFCDCMNCVHVKFVLFNTKNARYFCNYENCDQWKSSMKKKLNFLWFVRCQNYRSLGYHSMPMGGFDLSTVFFNNVISPDGRPLNLLWRWTHEFFIYSLGSPTSISVAYIRCSNNISYRMKNRLPSQVNWEWCLDRTDCFDSASPILLIWQPI